MDYTQPNPYKYKGLTFAIMVLNVLFAIAGVLFFIDVYYIFCILSISYAILKYIQMIGILIYVNFGYKQCMISYR